MTSSSSVPVASLISVGSLAAFCLFCSAVILTYWLAVRWCIDRWRGAPPKSRFDRAFRSTPVGIALLGAAGVGLLCFADGFLIEPRRLTVTSYRIETPKIPAGENVRIVQIADLHVRAKGPRERRLPDLVRALEPDVILHTGDFFAGGPEVEPLVVDLLRSWDVPQYACEGNLDRLAGFDRTMQAAGVKVLNGASATLNVRGATFTVWGFMTGAEDLIPTAMRATPPDRFTILLYHHPEGFPKAWDAHVDLMLAGHVHGGQVRLPGYGALITLDRYGKRWEYGRFDEHGATLIVSRGLGCEPHVPEVRFLCPPEVVVVDLIGTARPH